MVKVLIIGLLLLYFPGLLTSLISTAVGQAFIAWVVWGVLMTIKAEISDYLNNN